MVGVFLDIQTQPVSIIYCIPQISCLPSLSLSLPVIPHYSVNMHWPWLLHDAKCIEIWKAGGWINEIQHTDVHKLYVSLYYIYIYIRIHTHVVFLQLVPATARRNWIWSSNFPFLRWRSAFAETGEFLFRLLLLFGYFKMKFRVRSFS